MFQTKRLTFDIPKRKIVIAGLVLRLFISPFVSHPFDERVFMAVGVAVARGTTPYGQYVLQDIFAASPHPHLYGTFNGIGYPPVWGLIAGGMFALSSFAAQSNLYAYVFALKIPIILGEIALAILVYNILKVQLNERIALASFFLFLFCPFIISVGTIWGMFDVIALTFALLSAYVLHSRWKLSAAFLSASSALKLFPIVFAPVYSILLYKSTRKLKPALFFLATTAGIASFFTFVPMIAFNWPLSNMYSALTYHVATTNPSYDSLAGFPYGAASPFNVFALASNLAGGGIQPPSILNYLWIPACIFIYGFLLGNTEAAPVVGFASNKEFTMTIQWSLLVVLTFFTTRVWVSEQNLIFLFTFFCLSVFLQFPQLLDRVELMWLMMFIFVLVHVPVVSFFWMPFPATLYAANSFADGPLGWTRLLLMTGLTFSWLAMSWHYVARKLRWWPRKS